MPNPAILIGSQIESTITPCKDVAEEMHIQCCIESKIEDFLLSIQENDYHAAIFDLDMEGFEALKTIRLIRNLRPKLPLITVAKDVNKKLGGQIYDVGVFHLIMSPPSRESIRSVLKAISNT